ncbi:MAG: Fic family protein [Gammaproteobacteria bacterium]|jgi:Fic family protein
MDRKTGDFVEASLSDIGRYRAFIPLPLPPEPAIEWSPELGALRDKANRALGRLDMIDGILPDKHLFLYQYIRKEAVLSSQIEGTQSSISDLLLYELDEAPGVPLDDVREVSNYVAAMTHGLKRIEEGFPLSLRLLKEIHRVLLDGARGRDKEPGEFRRSQVWLGGPTPAVAEFVPPPPDRLMDCLDPFERYLHDDRQYTPVLIKAALAHVQFETIHPFKDGNGRLGRLLITLLLCAEDVLREPMLYLSVFFKQNRQAYYDNLQAVRTKGDWERWLGFFFQGVYEAAGQAVGTAQSLLKLFDEDRQKLQRLGRAAGSAIRLQQHLQASPITTAAEAAKTLTLSDTAINNAFSRLQNMGIVKELTGQQRYRVFAYDQYMRILAEGTEPFES